jgi:putative transposase
MSTKPRRVVPGVTYMVTRRCSERRFFLHPDPQVTWNFEYLLGVLAAKYGIEVHAYVVMSNHYHLVVTDVQGVMPDFQRELNSLLARSVNALRGRRESFWDRRSYSAVKLLEDDDVVGKIAYTLANPVAARLVEQATEWEGATSAGMQFGEERVVPRPSRFFGETMPEFVELRLTRPPCHAGVGDRELERVIGREVEGLERKHGEVGPALGMQEVMKQSWRASPESVEKWFQIQPTVAGNKWARIEALQASAKWLGEYREALGRFVSGERDVEFPVGTWWMRVRLGCPVAAAAAVG